MINFTVIHVDSGLQSLKISPRIFSSHAQRSFSSSCFHVSWNKRERLSRPFPRFLVLDASSTLPHFTPAVTATALAMFPRKRRTLEILARNVGSGGREAAVETHGGGKGGLPGWEAFHFLGDFRQTRRFRHIGADADATVDVESVRVPALPGSGSGLPRPRSPPRCPPSSRLELPPTPPGAPSPSAPSLRRSPFASVRTTLRTPRHQAFPPPRRWCSSFQLVCDTRYAVNVTCTIIVNTVVADALGSKTYQIRSFQILFFSWKKKMLRDINQCDNQFSNLHVS